MHPDYERTLYGDMDEYQAMFGDPHEGNLAVGYQGLVDEYRTITAELMKEKTELMHKHAVALQEQRDKMRADIFALIEEYDMGGTIFGDKLRELAYNTMI